MLFSFLTPLIRIYSKILEWRSSTYADFECLDSVVQQQYVAHNLCVLPVSLQLRRPDIVGSASRQAEACAHHAPTRVCNNQRHSREEETISEGSKRSNGKRKWGIFKSWSDLYTYYINLGVLQVKISTFCLQRTQYT